MPRARQEPDIDRALAFGALVKRHRRAAKLTQAALASRVPMSQSNLSRIEAGDQGPPADNVIPPLAAALGIDPSVLLRAAGRQPGTAGFEQTVLEQLHGLRDDIAALREDITDKKR
jgi:transcriptional regulator with XRE-family HTH domain